MSWLYGRRFQTPVTPLITAIRAELYAEPYESIDWASCRNKCAPGDLFAPHPPVLDALFALLNTYERWVAPAWLRKRGMARAYELMRMDDEHTDCQALAPVSSPLHLVCRAVVEGPDSPAVKRHVLKVRDFMWMGPEGMRASGTNGSQLWDLAFTAQALVEAGLAIEPDFREGALKGLRWLDECQIRDNPKHMARSYRHPTKGAWPFSTREQGYTVSDCTSEALKAVIWLQELECVVAAVDRADGAATSLGSCPTAACVTPSTSSSACRTRAAASPATSPSAATFGSRSSTRPKSSAAS